MRRGYGMDEKEDYYSIAIRKFEHLVLSLNNRMSVWGEDMVWMRRKIIIAMRKFEHLVLSLDNRMSVWGEDVVWMRRKIIIAMRKF